MTNATSSQDDATLEIYVVDRLEGNRGSHPLRYLYKANRPLARLFIHCRQHLMSSKKVGPLDATNHRFVYRKKALSDEQTPAQLGMAAGVQNFIGREVLVCSALARMLKSA